MYVCIKFHGALLRCRTIENVYSDCMYVYAYEFTMHESPTALALKMNLEVM